MDRYRNLDVLRAVAALAVLVGHAYALGPDEVPLASASVHGALLVGTTAGVWLFFALSGFVIARPFVAALVRGEPLPALGAYATRRAARIYPLYWVALAFVLATLGSAGATWWELGAHIGLLHNLAPGRQGAIIFAAWTLTLEAIFYVLVPVAASAIRRRVRGPVPAAWLATGVVVVWAASVGWAVLASWLHDADGEPSLYLRRLAPALLAAFCPGILLAVAQAAETGAPRRALAAITRNRSGVWAGAGVLVALGVASASLEPGASESAVRSWLVGLPMFRQLLVVGFGLAVAAAVHGPTWRGPVARVGGWLGDRSYGIYLLHAVALYWLDANPRFVPLAEESGWVAFVVHVAYLAAISVVLAAASWRWVEQPAIRMASRVRVRAARSELVDEQPIEATVQLDSDDREHADRPE